MVGMRVVKNEFPNSLNSFEIKIKIASVQLKLERCINVNVTTGGL